MTPNHACTTWYYDFLQCTLPEGHEGPHHAEYLDAHDDETGGDYIETYNWVGAGSLAMTVDIEVSNT